MQDEKYEVPFIWTYRQDYLHEHMTRAHLWLIMDWHELYHKLILIKKRLLALLHAINEASKLTESDALSSVSVFVDGARLTVTLFL
jgi:transcriptional accessory protein Tex/SPT6